MSKVGFCPGNMQERLARGMQLMTGMMVRYKVINLSWLLTGEDLVSNSGDLY